MVHRTAPKCPVGTHCTFLLWDSVSTSEGRSRFPGNHFPTRRSRLSSSTVPYTPQRESDARAKRNVPVKSTPLALLLGVPRAVGTFVCASGDHFVCLVFCVGGGHNSRAMLCGWAASQCVWSGCSVAIHCSWLCARVSKPICEQYHSAMHCATCQCICFILALALQCGCFFCWLSWARYDVV